MDKNISFTLKVWRQKGPKAQGAFETYEMKDIPAEGTRRIRNLRNEGHPGRYVVPGNDGHPE